jgi:hypothetical protein
MCVVLIIYDQIHHIQNNDHTDLFVIAFIYFIYFSKGKRDLY